jgi:ankyrin repeat protein
MNAKLRELAEKYGSHPQFLGVEILEPNQKGDMGDTLLHLAAEIGNVTDIETLVAAGAKVNVVGDIGNTPLHSAALCGRTAAVEKLLSLGADTALRNELGQTPLDVARLGDRHDIVRLLKAR